MQYTVVIMLKKLKINKPRYVLGKIERFIKIDFPKKLVKKKNQVITFFHNLKTVKESDLSKKRDRTLNLVIKDWLLEIFVYGMLVTLCVSLLFKITRIIPILRMVTQAEQSNSIKMNNETVLCLYVRCIFIQY